MKAEILDITVKPADGYARAVDLLRKNSTEEGFVAAYADHANYRRVWSRDSVVAGLAALLSEEDYLIEAFRRSLVTLARHQGPQGEIPSNVSLSSRNVTYGAMAGRVDSVPWFLIGCGEYYRATGDGDFLEFAFPTMERAEFLLRCWELNNRGLIYVPQTGDWADQFIQTGYVLFVQLLYLQSQRTMIDLRRARGEKDDTLQPHEDRAERLLGLIRTNYWLLGREPDPDALYWKPLYDRAKASEAGRKPHWVSYFAPFGYSYRFDAFANVFASLLGVADADQSDQVDGYIDQLVEGAPAVLPSFHPVIMPRDQDWDELQATFTNVFRNAPHEYQNGGLWPVITGFYVADLARRSKGKRARRFLDGINWANALPDDDGEPWTFPEFVHGQNFGPGGTCDETWSAAAAIIGYRAIDGASVFRIT